jgi:hypothetical protein
MLNKSKFIISGLTQNLRFNVSTVKKTSLIYSVLPALEYKMVQLRATLDPDDHLISGQVI